MSADTSSSSAAFDLLVGSWRLARAVSRYKVDTRAFDDLPVTILREGFESTVLTYGELEVDGAGRFVERLGYRRLGEQSDRTYQLERPGRVRLHPLEGGERWEITLELPDGVTAATGTLQVTGAVGILRLTAPIHDDRPKSRPDERFEWHRVRPVEI